MVPQLWLLNNQDDQQMVFEIWSLKIMYTVHSVDGQLQDRCAHVWTGVLCASCPLLAGHTAAQGHTTLHMWGNNVIIILVYTVFSHTWGQTCYDILLHLAGSNANLSLSSIFNSSIPRCVVPLCVLLGLQLASFLVSPSPPPSSTLPPLSPFSHVQTTVTVFLIFPCTYLIHTTSSCHLLTGHRVLPSYSSHIYLSIPRSHLLNMSPPFFLSLPMFQHHTTWLLWYMLHRHCL